MKVMERLNDLLEYSNRKIYQNSNWFAFSIDSVLLANFVTLTPSNKRILDIGTGTAPIPLILSLKTKAHITGVEIQEDVAKLAEKSIKYNHLEKQIDIVSQDIKEFSRSMESDSYDVIVCNPPYFKVNEKSYHNIDFHKTLARHELTLELEEVFRCVKKLLKNNGVFAMVHRTSRIIEILNLYKKYGLEPKKIQFIYPKKNQESNLVLIEGVKNGRMGTKVLSPLIVHEDDNRYTKEYLKFIEEE